MKKSSALLHLLQLQYDIKYKEMQLFFIEQLIKNDKNKLLEKDALFNQIRNLVGYKNEK
ncbi:hypothetical protein HYU06_03190 [Candidatus Woesearchaeota archaeon]|nr:hypothetical protein [Candidatus Woesearchaeota archaeon]